MPAAKKGKVINKKGPSISEDDDSLPKIDVQYNPDIVDGLLEDLKMQVEAKCNQLQKDSDFMVTSLQQAFHLELIKLPSQVKTMSLRRFRDEYGDSLEAVTRGAMGGRLNQSAKGNSSSTMSHSSHQKPFQTPLGPKGNPSRSNIMSTIMRNPKEGEKMLSLNGSPLGDFRTVVKAPKGDNSRGFVPPTPGVFIPLESGDVIDMETMDVSTLSQGHKEDALAKMQAMMNNIQMAMSKLTKSNKA